MSLHRFISDIQNQIILSQTGEIGREFKELYEKLTEEERQQKLEEEIASKKAIFELFKNEFKKPLLPTLHKTRIINKENSNNMLVAGPSHAYQTCIGGNRTANTLIGGRGSISKSNTSVITISSTSSPSCSSSMSNSFGLFKTVVEVVSRGKEIIKQKVSEKIFPNNVSRKDSKSFSNSPNLVLPTHTHKRSSSRSSSVDSNDSLKSEIRHFKPIRTAPTTPKKL